jgi:hypothetical protein
LPRYLDMVFALAGDSTTIRFFDMAMGFAIPRRCRSAGRLRGGIVVENDRGLSSRNRRRAGPAARQRCR